MDGKKFDRFLDRAVGSLSKAWEKAGGKELDTDQQADLARALERFFAGADDAEEAKDGV